MDAIHPDDLRELVRGRIEQHIDYDQLERLQRIEAAERETLDFIVQKFADDGAGEEGTS